MWLLIQTFPKEIFKAYDIRGIVGKTLTAEVVESIGHAIGSEATVREQHTIAIGRDGRLSLATARCTCSSVTLANSMFLGVKQRPILSANRRPVSSTFSVF